MKPLKLVLLLLVPLLAVTAFALLATGTLPYKVYVIHTGSMTPTIPSKSAVVVRKGYYRIGQVVSFTEQGEIVTHRLVGISARGLTITKGDANRTVDPWHVPRSQIIGGVVAAPRQLGYWLEYLKHPVGSLSILLSLLACWEIWSFAGGAVRRPAHRVRQRPRSATRTEPRHRIGSNPTVQRASHGDLGWESATTSTWRSGDGDGHTVARDATFMPDATPAPTRSIPHTTAPIRWETPIPPEGPLGPRPRSVPSLVPSIGSDGMT